MLKLLRYLDKRPRGQALLTLVFVILQVWLDLTLPDYMATITSLAETPRLHHGPDPRPGRLHDAVRRRLARVQRHLRLPRLPRGGGPLAHPSREGLQPGARPLARGRRPLRRGVARQPLHERHNPDPEPRLDGPLGHRQGPCHGDLGRREDRRLRLGVDARDRRGGALHRAHARAHRRRLHPALPEGPGLDRRAQPPAARAPDRRAPRARLQRRGLRARALLRRERRAHGQQPHRQPRDGHHEPGHDARDLGPHPGRLLDRRRPHRGRRAGRAPHALLADGRLLELRHAGGPRVRAAQHDLRPAAARPDGRRARERGHRGRARRD